MPSAKTILVNRALDLVGKDALLDFDTDTSATARVMQRNYEPVMLRCLRRAEWSFAIKRVNLNPLASAPVNEFSFAFQLPGDMLKMIKLFPTGIPYKIENGRILCDENAITIKYVSNEALTDPSICDPSFAEYFAHELAVAVCYKFTDSVALRNELKKSAEEMFREAAAMFSQEDTDDPLPESNWVTARWTVGADLEQNSIRIAGIED